MGQNSIFIYNLASVWKLHSASQWEDSLAVLSLVWCQDSRTVLLETAIVIWTNLKEPTKSEEATWLKAQLPQAKAVLDQPTGQLTHTSRGIQPKLGIRLPNTQQTADTWQTLAEIMRFRIMNSNDCLLFRSLTCGVFHCKCSMYLLYNLKIYNLINIPNLLNNSILKKFLGLNIHRWTWN